MLRSLSVFRAGAAALLLLGSGSLAEALPIKAVDAGASPAMVVRDPYYRHGQRSHYHVNRYGYGHYTRGPGGSYGPYPAGSAGAQIYRQKRTRFCREAPSRC